MGAVAGKKLEPVFCSRCSFSSKRITSVEKHIQEEHAISAQELWNADHGGPTLCRCGCGKSTTWLNFKDGYSGMLKGHNASIYAVYDDKRAKQIATTRGVNWRNSPAWSKGLTKETDERVKARGEKTSKGRKKAFDEGKISIWSKGLTKKTDERIASAAMAQKELFASGAIKPWSSGLTKKTDNRIRTMSDRISLAHKNANLRKKLDAIKRLRVDEIKQRIETNGTLRVITESLSEYINDNTPNILVECTQCNTRFNNSLKRLQYGRCFTCDPSGSRGQQDVSNWLRSLSLNVDTNNRRIIGGQELDIFLPDHLVAVEYNGLYWHSILHKSSTYHNNKSELSAAAGISLFHVFEDEWNTKQDIVKSMLLHRVGGSARHIHARGCTVESINAKERQEFFDKNHIDGDVNAKNAIGLKFDGALVSCMSFRAPFHKKHADSLEVARYCCSLNTSIAGALGRLTSHAKRLSDRLITYVDTRLGSTGSAWIASGWGRSGETPPRFWWTDGSERFNRFKYRADPSRNLTEAQVAEGAGVVRIYGCKNLILTA